MPDQGVTSQVVGDFLGLTPRRIRQLAAFGAVERLGRGRYALEASVRGYVSWLQAKLDYGREEAPSDSQARLTAARADLAELEAEERRAALIPAADLQAGVDALLGAIRARLLKVPAEVSSAAARAERPSECQELVRSAFYDALSDIAAVKFQSR